MSFSGSYRAGDVTFPLVRDAGCELVTVAEGQRVRGGETVIARWPAPR